MANNLKTVFLLALLGGLFVGLGWLLGGQQGALFALGIAVLFNFAMYWFSDKMAIRAARARPASEQELPEVYSIVRSLAQREEMPVPDIYVISTCRRRPHPRHRGDDELPGARGGPGTRAGPRQEP